MPSLSLGIRIPAHRVRPNPRKNPEPGGPGWFYIGPPGEVDGPPGPDPTTYRVRVGSGFAGRVLKSRSIEILQILPDFIYLYKAAFHGTGDLDWFNSLL